MTCMWVTRTEPGAGRLARHLRSCGISVSVAPLLQVEAINTPLPIERPDVAVYLSQHAVWSTARDALCSERTFAVGPATQRALADRQVTSETPQRTNSEGLLELIAAHVPEGAKILIVCGEAGRGFLQRRLRTLGYCVREWCVYRRRYVAKSPRLNALCGIVELSSVGAVDVYAKLLKWDSQPDARFRKLLVPSSRVAVHARKLGFADVSLVQNASPDGYARHIRHLNRDE